MSQHSNMYFRPLFCVLYFCQCHHFFYHYCFVAYSLLYFYLQVVFALRSFLPFHLSLNRKLKISLWGSLTLVIEMTLIQTYWSGVLHSLVPLNMLEISSLPLIRNSANQNLCWIPRKQFEATKTQMMMIWMISYARNKK